MALISGIAHCNGVISEHGKDKGVCENVFKYSPRGAADVPKKPTQYSHSIARSLCNVFDTVNCQEKLKIFLFSCPCPLSLDFSSTLSSLSLSLSALIPLLPPPSSSNLAFSICFFPLFALPAVLFSIFSLFVSLPSHPVVGQRCLFHCTISWTVWHNVINVDWKLMSEAGFAFAKLDYGMTCRLQSPLLL